MDARRQDRYSVRMKKAPQPRMTLAEAMSTLEAAGSEQTRKTYGRHGITGPMFGVSFATLKTLRKRIGVDHELATALWDTGNYDARNLAAKIADPARMTADELDRWARGTSTSRSCAPYVAMLAAEGPHAAAKAAQWIGAAAPLERAAGWALLGQLACGAEPTPDAWFEGQLTAIERTIHTAPNDERDGMLRALIQIGCRNGTLRQRAMDTARRIGAVEIDYGDTACTRPDAVAQIEKAWAHSTTKGFESPAAHERTRERLRLRC